MCEVGKFRDRDFACIISQNVQILSFPSLPVLHGSATHLGKTRWQILVDLETWEWGPQCISRPKVKSMLHSWLRGSGTSCLYDIYREILSGVSPPMTVFSVFSAYTHVSKHFPNVSYTEREGSGIHIIIDRTSPCCFGFLPVRGLNSQQQTRLADMAMVSCIRTRTGSSIVAWAAKELRNHIGSCRHGWSTKQRCKSWCFVNFAQLPGLPAC